MYELGGDGNRPFKPLLWSLSCAVLFSPEQWFCGTWTTDIPVFVRDLLKGKASFLVKDTSEHFTRKKYQSLGVKKMLNPAVHTKLFCPMLPDQHPNPFSASMGHVSVGGEWRCRFYVSLLLVIWINLFPLPRGWWGLCQGAIRFCFTGIKAWPDSAFLFLMMFSLSPSSPPGIWFMLWAMRRV